MTTINVALAPTTRPLFDPEFPSEGYVSDAEWKARTTERAALAPVTEPNSAERLANLVLSMDMVTEKGLRARALAREVLANNDALLHALRLIQHATAPTPDDGGAHEAAYELATAAIERAAPTTTEPAPSTLRRAKKIGGSFQHTGTVVAEFTTTAGEPRIVVEFDAPVAGMLHIYRSDQVEPLPAE